MKIIFLDFDGVLNDQRSLEKYYREYHDNDFIDPEMVARLNKIIKATNANVVISSTWRYYYTLDELINKYLIPTGFIGNIIGTTPYENFKFSRYNNLSRGKEIQQWFNDHQEYNIESFVILDDDTEDMEIFKNNFVQTIYYNIPEGEDEYMKEGGLQDEHIDKAIRILNNIFNDIEKASISDIDINKAGIFTLNDYMKAAKDLISKK